MGCTSYRNVPATLGGWVVTRTGRRSLLLKSTIVYDDEVEERYEYTSDTLDHLAVAGVAPFDADFVLRTSRPCIRQHVGAVLRVTARDRRGHWLLVACVETVDDVYLVVAARYLDELEVHAATELLGDQL